jgi:hypothetical protein
MVARREKCTTCYWWDVDGDVAIEEIELALCRAAEPTLLPEDGETHGEYLEWPVSSSTDWCPRYRRRDLEARLSPRGVCPGCDAARVLVASMLMSIRNVANTLSTLVQWEKLDKDQERRYVVEASGNLCSALQHFESEMRALEQEPVRPAGSSFLR